MMDNKAGPEKIVIETDLVEGYNDRILMVVIME